MNCKISSKHIILNGLKHCFSEQLALLRVPNSSQFYEAMLKLGGSQMDVYTGSLTLDMIFQECLAVLTDLQLLTKAAYLEAIACAGGYFSVTFSDTSVWVFRQGEDSERFVHLHPGRYCPNSFRVKANSLKTVLALHFEKAGCVNKEIVNEIRKDKLNLSPVKSITFCDLYDKYEKR